MRIIHALNITIIAAIIIYAAVVGSYIGAGIWSALLVFYLVTDRRLAKED